MTGDGQAWERLAAAEPIGRRWQWLRAMSGRVGADARILGSDAGLLHCYRLDSPSSYSGFDPVKPVGGSANGYPAAVCAIPNSYLAGFVGADLTAAGEIWADWVDEQGAATSAWLHVEASRRSQVRTMLLDQGYQEFLSGTQAFLRLPAGGAGYLDQLNRHRRTRVRAEIRAFEESPLSIRSAAPTEFTQAHAELQLLSYAKYGFGGSVGHVMDSHRQAMEIFADGYRLLIAEDQDGRPMGFLSYFTDGRSAQPRHLGLVDDAVTRSSGLYFNLSYYRLVNELPQPGTTIVYGPKAVRVKRLRGCTIEPTYSYLRSTDEKVISGWRNRSAVLSRECEEQGVPL